MKHCIIVKFKKDYNYRDNLDDIKSIFNETLNIKGIHHIDYLLTNTDIESRSHLAIVMDMDLDSLDEYNNSNPHKLWKDKYKEHILEKMIFDFD